MNLILKRDPVWLGCLPSPNASPTLLLIGGDGQQVAVPAPLLLAVSPLVRSILADLLPPVFSPCILSIPTVTEEVLHVMVDILATGAASGEHMDEIEDVRQVFEMLGVDVSLVSYRINSGQADHVLDRGVEVEDSSEVIDIPLDEENIIKIEVTVKTEDNENADVEKSKTLIKSLHPQIITRKSTKISCNFCPQEYTKKQNLMRHIRSIHKLVKFPCNQCPQTFTQKQDLVRHIISIHDQVKFSCNLCPQKFSQEKYLVIHIKSVHDQIKIPCKFCPKKFNLQNSLLKHIKTVHDQIKVFCKLCPQKFKQKESLVRHIKSVHDQIKIPCNLCSQEFAQKKSLVKHVKSIHGKI